MSYTRWLPYLNLALVASIALFGGMIFLFPSSEEPLILPSYSLQKGELPKNPFAQPEEAYREIGERAFALAWSPPEMQLPDLKGELVFYGMNLRPDIVEGQQCFHLALRGTDEVKTVREGEKIFLVYKGNYSQNFLEQRHLRESSTSFGNRPLWGELPLAKGGYEFSPGNQPTPLWVELKAFSPQSLQIRASMLDEKGALIRSPDELAAFTLQAQEFPKGQLSSWELGGCRVDTTLLVRQKARWIGPDRFLELHGGAEFEHALGKERIDFLEGELPYSCFVKANDRLVWKQSRWEEVQKGENTLGLPLLVVKKLDEKIMSFELWDSVGKGKTLLNLVRLRDHGGVPNISQEFKFVGAKTWAQFIVESRTGGRLNLKPHDWLVLTQEGWKKLDSTEEVDDYVEQRIVGPLFILDKLTKQNGRQVLVGHLFNTSRTEVEEVELAAASNTSLASTHRTMSHSCSLSVENNDREGMDE